MTQKERPPVQTGNMLFIGGNWERVTGRYHIPDYWTTEIVESPVDELLGHIMVRSGGTILMHRAKPKQEVNNE